LITNLERLLRCAQLNSDRKTVELNVRGAEGGPELVPVAVKEIGEAPRAIEPLACNIRASLSRCNDSSL
jgi:hypothetical protein